MYYIEVSEPESSYCIVSYPFEENIKYEGDDFYYRNDIEIVERERVFFEGSSFCAYKIFFDRPDFTRYCPQINYEYGDSLDFFTSPTGVHLVNESFKRIVESIETDVHLFWPTDVNVNGRSVGGYYYMVVGTVIDFSNFFVEDFSENIPGMLSGGYVKALRNESIGLDFINCQGCYSLFSYKGYCQSMIVNDYLADKFKSEVITGLWDKNNIPEFELDRGIKSI